MVEGGTTPKFNMEMFFCVHTNTTHVALEDCFGKEKIERQDSIEIVYHKYEEQLIQRQDGIIKALEKQISEAEQELYEKDKEIARLENDLEEVCEELFLEVNLR
jgi:hypothetical protein